MDSNAEESSRFAKELQMENPNSEASKQHKEEVCLSHMNNLFAFLFF